MAMTVLQPTLFHMESEKGKLYGNDCIAANLVPRGIGEREAVWQRLYRSQLCPMWNRRKGSCMTMTVLQATLYHVESEKGKLYDNDCIAANLVPCGIGEREAV